MAPERRSQSRRRSDLIARPGEATDVARIEFENLTQQVAANVRALRRIEHDLQRIRTLVEELHGLKDAS
jgi:hypothetical protein